MCLVVLSLGEHPDYPLILAANRDEFYARPTRDANWWPDKPDVVGGRDLQAGGAWLAAHRGGRFATVTNFGEARRPEPRQLSRGLLVTGFLDSDMAPADYLGAIDGDAYAGFNLIVGDSNGVAYLSNRDDGVRELVAGTYGLSNTLLDGPWHKIERSKKRMLDLVSKGAPLAIVADPAGHAEMVVEAPYDGVVIGRTNLPLVYEGDATFHIARYGRKVATVEKHVEQFHEEHQPELLLDPEDDISSAPIA